MEPGEVIFEFKLALVLLARAGYPQVKRQGGAHEAVSIRQRLVQSRPDVSGAKQRIFEVGGGVFAGAHETFWLDLVPAAFAAAPRDGLLAARHLGPDAQVTEAFGFF